MPPKIVQTVQASHNFWSIDYTPLVVSIPNCVSLHYDCITYQRRVCLVCFVFFFVFFLFLFCFFFYLLFFSLHACHICINMFGMIWVDTTQCKTLTNDAKICWLIVTTDAQHWSGAARACVRRGGSLAIEHSAETGDKIRQELRKFNRNLEFWFGLRKLKFGSYVWIHNGKRWLFS